MGKYPNVQITALADTIVSQLKEFSFDIDGIMKDVIDEVTAETLDDLRNNANVPVDTGDYAKSFYSKNIQNGTGRKTNVVANKEYQLTHLLEYGHKSRKGVGSKGKTAKKSNPNSQATVEGHSHWAEAEKIVDTLPDKIRKRVKEYNDNN